MMYGVPNLKPDKIDVVQRRIDMMAEAGVDCGTFNSGWSIWTWLLQS
ncbi:putative glutamate synthase (NADH) [Helianthus anomalus]